MELAGKLYQKYVDGGGYLHTHLNESEGEIEWVKELYPEFESYIDVYKHYGFIDKRTVLAHCCLMSEHDWQTLHKHEATVDHCPSTHLCFCAAVFRFLPFKSFIVPVAFGFGA